MKVLFVDGTGGFSPLRLAERPCGGIITSLTLIPQYLAKHGHEVVVASEYVGESVGGVEYVREVRQKDYETDIVVFNRNTYNHEFLNHFKGSRFVWWLHDIVDYRYMYDDAYMRMDRIVALSNYCEESYASFFGIPRDKFVVIPNGVDKTLFYPAENNPGPLFVCASATIKGLYPLSFTWDNLKRIIPGAELRLYGSQSLHDKEDSPQVKGQLKALQEAGARVLDPIPQAELAKVFQSAAAVLMPNHYPEICSNIMLQALACGTPVVSSDIGSASEFITNGTTGYVTQTKPHDMFWWHKDFAELALTAGRSQTLRGRAWAFGPASVKTWDEIGEMWKREIERGN